MQGLTYLLGSLAAVLTALIGAYVAWRKLPYERTSLTVRSADEVNVMTLRFAKAAGDEANDLQLQLDALRVSFEAYRTDTEARLTELATELREERVEKRQVKAELDQRNAAISTRDERISHLEQKVALLESEVRRLTDATQGGSA